MLSNARRNTGTLGTTTEAYRWRGGLGARVTALPLLSYQRRSWGLSDVHALRRRTRPVLEGLLDLTKAIPFETARLSVKARAVTFQMLGKNRHIPESGVEIDFWHG
jgi:hypothetical protein